MGSGPRFAKGPCMASLILAPEQGVGGVAVRSGGEAVFFHPRDFTLEQVNSLGQFVLRIGAEVLGGELARGIAARSGTIVVFHRCALFRSVCLLSMAPLATPQANFPGT